MVSALVQPQSYRPKQREVLLPADIVYPRWSVAVREPTKKGYDCPDMGTMTVGLSRLTHDVSVDFLERTYVFRERDLVLPFLRQHFFLIPALLEAPAVVWRYFPFSPLVLEVVTDPEVPDDEQLMMYISTEVDAEEALSRLNQLDEDWWLDALEQVEGKMCIDLEFV